MNGEIHVFKPGALRRAVTAEESRRLDRHAMQVKGLQGADLMETAGRGAADIILGMDRFRTGGPWTVLALCGTGNNGGDAIVAAHHLALSGAWRPRILLMAPESDLTDDARHHLKAFREQFPDAGFEIADGDLVGGPGPTARGLWNVDLVLDGLLGTGFHGTVREPMASLIRSLNEAAAAGGPAIVAMDVPSGLDATTGRASRVSSDAYVSDAEAITAVKASDTVTFGYWKTGVLFADGPALAGRVHLVELPFDETILTSSIRVVSLEDRSDGGPIAPVRRTHGHRHKYDGGVVHVIGGSPGLSGAAIMAGKAAWRKGAGAVLLHGAAGLLARFEGHHPWMISSPSGSPEDLALAPSHAESIVEAVLRRPGAVLLGPGLGPVSARNGFVDTLLELLADTAPDSPLVLDADALRNLDGILRRIPAARTVLTPHPAELASIPGVSAATGPDGTERLHRAADLAARTGFHICSKGTPTIACGPGGEAVVTSYDTSTFHRAGFGDVLAGQITANLSFGAEPMHAILDALLHGLAKASAWTSETPFAPEDAC